MMKSEVWKGRRRILRFYWDDDKQRKEKDMT